MKKISTIGVIFFFMIVQLNDDLSYLVVNISQLGLNSTVIDFFKKKN